MGRSAQAVGSNAATGPGERSQPPMREAVAIRTGDLMSRTNIAKALLVTALFLIGRPLLLAQHAGHGGQSGNPDGQIARGSDVSRAEQLSRTQGRLVSQSEDSITIETIQNGEPARFTYTVDDRTDFRGAVRVGSPVSVTHIEQNGLRAATKVEGQRKRRGC